MAYVPTTFSCPHCQAPLRLRQRPGGTLHLPCPDCHRPLELSDQVGELLVRPAEAIVGKGGPRPSLRTVGKLALPKPKPLARRVKAAAAKSLANPLVVTWLAAGIAAVALGVAFLRSGRETRPVASVPVRRASDVPDDRPEVTRAAEPVVPVEEQAVPEETPTVAETPAPPLPAVAVVEQRPPVIAPRPPASPPVDPREAVAARLAQKLLRFEQPTPVPFDTVRLQIEDIVGVPIRYDESVAADSPSVKAPVRLSLVGVTLDEVLGEAARQAELAHVLDADGVRLVPAADRLQANRDGASGPAAVP
jgi:hypothetical protein